MPFPTSGQLGANIDNVDTVAAHKLGDERLCDDGTTRRYMKASVAVAANDALKQDNADGSYSVRPTTAVNEAIEGVSPVAIAGGSFAWIIIDGPATVKAAAATAAGSQLGTTATAGTLAAKVASAAYAEAEADAALAIAAGRGLIARTAEAGGTLTALLR